MVRNWELSGGAARLELALEDLRAARAEAAHSWHDATSRKFDDTYLVPLDPRVCRALEAVRRLADLLSQAKRECDNQ